MHEEKWGKQAVEKADTALKKALVTNFEPLESIEVWLTGGVVNSGGPNVLATDSFTLNARLHYTDGGLEKLWYPLNPEDLKQMTGAKGCFEWATGYLAAHLMKLIYRIEYNKADIGIRTAKGLLAQAEDGNEMPYTTNESFPGLDDSLAERMPDHKRKTEKGNPYDK